MTKPAEDVSPPTQEERDAVGASLSVLPAELRTPTVASVLLMALRNEEIRRRLWADPREFLKRYDVDIRANVRIVTHDPQKDGIVLVLPRSGSMAPTSVGASSSGGKVDLAESDLRSGRSSTIEFGPLSKDKDWMSPFNDGDKTSSADDKMNPDTNDQGDLLADKDKPSKGDPEFD